MISQGEEFCLDAISIEWSYDRMSSLFHKLFVYNHYRLSVFFEIGMTVIGNGGVMMCPRIPTYLVLAVITGPSD